MDNTLEGVAWRINKGGIYCKSLQQLGGKRFEAQYRAENEEESVNSAVRRLEAALGDLEFRTIDFKWIDSAPYWLVVFDVEPDVPKGGFRLGKEDVPGKENPKTAAERASAEKGGEVEPASDTRAVLTEKQAEYVRTLYENLEGCSFDLRRAQEADDTDDMEAAADEMAYYTFLIETAMKVYRFPTRIEVEGWNPNAR